MRQKSSLTGSIFDLFRVKPNKRASSSQTTSLTVNYETLEDRRVLASLFPTYVDGQFTLGDDTGATPYALEDTFKLASLPSATKTIYLDFTGHHSVNNRWGHDIVFPAWSRDADTDNFSDSELTEIQLQFQNVAEDFLPFGVNVTTIEPDIEDLRKTSNNDNRYGVRAVNTQATDGFGDNFGGVAYLNSFDDDEDNPVFTINKGENVGAMTNSHEVGHALGLNHDGLGTRTYHPGAGSGEIGWGPIMGAPFSSNLTQWSNGDYFNSTNTEDDFAVITKNANGFDFRPDDHGSTIAAAADLGVTNETDVFQWGIVERNTDTDMFRFETGDGQVTLNINAFGERANLDVLATLYDDTGAVVATSNPADSLSANFDINLSEGVYYIGVEGTGNANSSDYGSIGFYTIDGVLTPPNFVEPVGESGTVDINHVWKTVQLDRVYNDPVIVFGSASRNGGSPVTIRVANVTPTSFRVQLDEWDYLDGRHSLENVGYVVMEAGVHELADGTILQAGNKSGVTHRWNNFDFEPGLFSSTPLVFSQTTSFNDNAAVATRARNIDTNGFQVRLQEEQGADRVHGEESVAWIAIEEVGVGTLKDGSQFQASQTGGNVSHRPYTASFDASFADSPVFLAAMQSYFGGDVSTVRTRGLSNTDYTVNIEEEKSFDDEISHNAESVGIFAMRAGEINGQVDNGGESAPVAGNGFDDYSANSNTPEAWAAYAEMLARPDVAISLDHIHCEGEEHHPEEAHGDNCGCPNCTGAASTAEQQVDNRVNFMVASTDVETQRSETGTQLAPVAPQVISVMETETSQRQVVFVDIAFEDLFETEDDDNEDDSLVDLDVQTAVI